MHSYKQFSWHLKCTDIDVNEDLIILISEIFLNIEMFYFFTKLFVSSWGIYGFGILTPS
jgi:hypothetical protein